MLLPSRKLSHPPKGVLFDLDGTLLDTEPLGCKAVYLTMEDKMSREAKDAFRDRNYAMEWELKQQTLGLPDREWPPIVLEWAQRHWGVAEEESLTVDTFLKSWDAHMWANMATVGTMKGAQALVKQLATVDKIPLAIATSSRSQAVERKRQGHEDLFCHIQTIVTTDDPSVKQGKPAPDIYLEAARRLNVDPQQCLVFEDGMTGVKAGKAAGCFVVAIPDARCTASERRFFEEVADLVLHDLTEFDISMVVEE